jgi:alpha-galactosidase
MILNKAVISGILSLLLLATSNAKALENNLARTPPMGWNSWNKFACDVNEKLIKEMADAMVESGMRDAGYKYLVIDDCWQKSNRDERGNIVADANRFPSGIKSLAEYIHSKRLKFGLYSDAGTYTCAGHRPGSKGYEFQDAKQYAAWGVDYLKYDWCNTEGQDAPKSYAKMRDALKAAGRPIAFSICEWGLTEPWTWAKDVGNLWRTTGDITDSWSSEGVKKGQSMGDFGPPPAGVSKDLEPPVASVDMFLGFLQILDRQENLADYAGPGHWNDPDMLEVGNGGMTVEEYRAHFSLWAILAAPLIAGNDLRNMAPDIKEILTNKEVIAVDQDVLGKQGRRIKRSGNMDIWMKELSGGRRAVAFLNRGEAVLNMTVTWAELGLSSKQSLAVRHLWQHKDLGTYKGQFATSVPVHSVVMIVVKAK